MSNEEKILKYFSEQLNSEEKKNFENEIEKSEDLKKEFFRFQKTLSEIKTISTPEVEENYFINLTPKIRNRMEKKRKFLIIPKIALSFSALAIILVISFNIINDNNRQIMFSFENEKILISEAIEESSNDQLNDYISFSLNYRENNFSVFTDEIEFEIEKLGNLTEKTLETFDEYDLIDKLSEEEANEIYNQLLNTKIL